MWYTVPPGASSPADCHPERELSVVVSGCGVIEASDGSAGVKQGDAFLFESMETHVVRNLSPDTPLMVFSTYWMPLAEGRSA
jgi:mannose-6-phosphate isomerase-like protein (cupin superfamily)